MAYIDPPDYSLLSDIDILRDYSDDEIEAFYILIHHLHKKNHIEHIKQDKYHCIYGNFFGYSELIFHEQEISTLMNDIEKDVIDAQHRQAIILYFTGKITRNELNKISFNSWFKYTLRSLRERFLPKEDK